MPCSTPHPPISLGLPPVAAISELIGSDGHTLAGSTVERFALRPGPMMSTNELVARLEPTI